MRDKIATHGRIIVTGAHRGCIATPTHGPFGIEQPAAIDGAGGHFPQVVGGCKFGTIEPFVLQITAITIDFHLAQVAESGFADEGFCELINARLGHADLGPTPRSQHRMGGISLLYGGAALGQQPALGALERRGLHAEHETHENAILAVAENERAECHRQGRLLAGECHRLHGNRHFGKRCAREPVIGCNVGGGGIDELRIVYRDRIERICIVGGKGHDI